MGDGDGGRRGLGGAGGGVVEDEVGGVFDGDRAAGGGGEADVVEFDVGGLVDDEADFAGGVDVGEAELRDGVLGEADDRGDLGGVFDRDVGGGKILEDRDGFAEGRVGEGW